MEIIIKESSMIFPAEDTPNERHWISNADMVMTAYHVPVLYIYKKPNYYNSQVLKEALSKNLVEFYPMAGRLGINEDDNGRFEIICNGEGVLFIEAEASVPLYDDLDDLVTSFKMQQLVPPTDYSSRDLTSYPLVMIQVTTFKCGGVCLGTKIQHSLADGTSASHFIKSWSELARGLSQIKEAPVIDRTLLKARVPPTPTFHHIEYHPPPTLLNDNNIKTSFDRLKPDNKPLSVSVFKITSDQINTQKLKAKSSSSSPSNNNNYTTFSILAAYIWRCACKARGLQDDQRSQLYMQTNGRPRLDPPLPSGYLGNAVFFASLIALSGNLQSEPLINTVDKIQRRLKRMDNEYLRSAIDHLEKLPDIRVARSLPSNYYSPNLSINNWTRLHLGGTDFGWGRPVYMVPAHVTHEGKMFLLPSTTNDGGLLLVACLQTSHMNDFQKHLYQGLVF